MYSSGHDQEVPPRGPDGGSESQIAQVPVVRRGDADGADEAVTLRAAGPGPQLHATPGDLGDELDGDGAQLWELIELLAESDAPQLLHDVLRQVSRVCDADEVSLFAGQAPPVLITAHGRRVFAEQRKVVDRRLLHAVASGEIVSLQATDPLHGWRVDHRTAVRAGLWVPAPPDASTPAVVRVLRVRAGPFPRGTERLLTIVARRLAGALHRLQQQRFDQTRDAERTQLFLVSTSIARELDFEAVAQRVVSGVTAVTDFAAATVEVRRGATVRRAAATGDDELAVGITSPLRLWREALGDEQKVGELTYRVTLRNALPAHDDGTQTALAGLVTELRDRRGDVIGFLTLSRPRTGAEPSTEMIQTVELFAGQAQIALVNASLYRDARRQRDIARTLMRVTTAVSTSLDPDEILATCCEAAQTHSAGERATMYRVDEHGRVEQTISVGHDSRAATVEPPDSLDECALLTDAAEGAEPLIVDDVASSVRYATSRTARTLAPRSLAAYPLRAGDQVLGLLLVDHHTRRVRFSESEVALLSQIATQAAVALRQSALHAQTREQAARNAQLLELTTAMTATFQFDAIFARIVDAVRSRMDGHSVAVLRIRDDALHVIGTATGGRLRSPRPPLRLPLHDDFLAELRSMCDAGTLRVDDVRDHAGLARIALPTTRSVLLAAPHDRTETDVLVTVSSTRHGAYTGGDARFLADLAQIVKLAVRNAELFDEVSQAARHDPLTGLLNRRVFWDTLQARLASLPRAVTLAVAVIDADNFKRINDRLGHAAGDGALVHIADRLRRAVRSTDTVFRVGGEEFTVVLPEATDRDALTVMERVRRAVADGPPDAPPLSVSIGVAVAPYDGRTADAVFTEADRALLQAKREGKDRVVLRSELP